MDFDIALLMKFVWLSKFKTHPVHVDQWKFLNPFYATGLFLYLLKTPENQTFSDVFRGYRKRRVR